MIDLLLSLLPEPQSSALMALAMHENTTEEQWKTSILKALESLDWEAQRDQIGLLMSRFMPIETLVPDVYDRWRPVVRDAFAYVTAHLATKRLVPKLFEQMLLPRDLSLDQRLMILIANMPSLQKIGQIIARNRHLEPSFRAQLIQLENSIQDVTTADIHTEIVRQLGPQLTTYSIDIEDAHRAEGSVSAVVYFTWIHPVTSKRERGVFKVLKPYVREYFLEELKLLQGLAECLEANCHKYLLERAPLREVFNDVSLLLAQEINVRQEQDSLQAARQRYADVAGVRIPRFIPELSTATITAMTEEEGVKVTATRPSDFFKRRQLAARLIVALLAVPLFAQEEFAVFHADPHAGNLFVDEKTGDLIIFDWALTERLCREERRQFMRLVFAAILRDEHDMRNAIATLSSDEWTQDPTQNDLLRRHVADFIRTLSPCTMPGLTHIFTLLDTLFLSGVRFPASVSVFRKVLFTLNDVLNDVAPNIRIEPVLLWYMLTQGKGDTRPLNQWYQPSANFSIPLSAFDHIALCNSIVSYGGRLWLQTAEQRWGEVNREFLDE
jgi:predicted unusual protein kinase regulating ubiquinone biosynthesis (AarF/ABC1/UbiB family)